MPGTANLVGGMLGGEVMFNPFAMDWFFSQTKSYPPPPLRPHQYFSTCEGNDLGTCIISLVAGKLVGVDFEWKDA